MRRKVANARIDFRTTAQRKHVFELAAFLGGYGNLSNFITEASDSLAKSILDNLDESRELSDRDRDLLVSMLKTAPEPNAALKKAYAKAAHLCQLDQNGQAVYELGQNLFQPRENGDASHP
jgi:uncharacterized protein (DUF1778 family)